MKTVQNVRIPLIIFFNHDRVNIKVADLSGLYTYDYYLYSQILLKSVHIRKTCPCNIYPYIPHFYIVKLGYAGVYLFFLFLLQIIDCEKRNISIFF